MKLIKAVSISAIAAGLALTAAVTGCGGGTGPNPPAPPPTPPPPPPGPVVAAVIIAPRGYTLPVGGQGQLTAVANDAAGSATGITITWSTQNPSVASASTSGMVIGHAAGQTRAIASAQGKADSVTIVVTDNFTLAVTPSAATTDIGSTSQFAVVAHDGSGNVITAPPVVWGSASPAVATISASGLATGVSAGTASITARAGTVVALPGLLTVRDTATAAAACDGIAGIDTFVVDIDYGYKAVGLVTDGGFVVDADDMGLPKASMTRFTDGPFVAGWGGDNTGNASITQKLTSGNDVTRFSGGGSMVPLGGLTPKVTFLVNLQTCTYRLIALATLNVRQTDPDGTVSNSDQPVASIQFAGPLGAWRTLGIVEFTGPLPTHPLFWLTLNPDTSALSPQGAAAKLGDNMGQGSGGFSLFKR